VSQTQRAHRRRLRVRACDGESVLCSYSERRRGSVTQAHTRAHARTGRRKRARTDTSAHTRRRTRTHSHRHNPSGQARHVREPSVRGRRWRGTTRRVGTAGVGVGPRTERAVVRMNVDRTFPRSSVPAANRSCSRACDPRAGVSTRARSHPRPLPAAAPCRRRAPFAAVRWRTPPCLLLSPRRHRPRSAVRSRGRATSADQRLSFLHAVSCLSAVGHVGRSLAASSPIGPVTPTMHVRVHHTV
jgi:hypothetical protein